MAMEIKNNQYNYPNYGGYMAKKAEVEKTAESNGAEKTVSKGEKPNSTEEYLKRLQKQIPAMELKVGDGFAQAKGRITHCITISPQLLEKMMNDPETEKEQIQHLKDIERASNYARSFYNSQGGEIVKHNDQWYIDGKGNHSHYGEIRIDNKANKKIYEEAKEKEKKRLDKSREKAREKAKLKKKEFNEKLEEKRAEKAAEIKDEAQKAAEEILDKKLTASVDKLAHEPGTNIDIQT